MIKKIARDSAHSFFFLLISLLLVLVLLFSSARPAFAAVGVTSILIPAVIATLEAWGIGTAADGLDGADIAEWFHDKLTSWSTYAGIALENIAIGIKMTPLGQVLLNPIALAGVREFGAWLVQDEGLVAGGASVPVISAGFTFNGYEVWTTASGDFGLWHYDYDLHNCYCFFQVPGDSSNKSQFSFVSDVSGAYLTKYMYYNGNLQSSYNIYLSKFGTSNYYWARDGFTGDVTSALPSVSYTVSQVLNGSGGIESGEGSLDLVPSAEMDVPTAADVQDKELLLNTSLDVGADAQAWYDSIMNKVAANDLTATGTITQAGTITADQVIPQEGITEVDGEIEWPAVTSPIGVSGLDEIFPFCIPFDIYHFFEALAADPVAPSFEIPFRIEGVVDYTFEIDLQPFDQVAQVLRLLELLAFCVGLAFVTRSMFIRG